MASSGSEMPNAAATARDGRSIAGQGSERTIPPSTATIWPVT
jgi:hypothetical protein